MVGSLFLFIIRAYLSLSYFIIFKWSFHRDKNMINHIYHTFDVFSILLLHTWSSLLIYYQWYINRCVSYQASAQNRPEFWDSVYSYYVYWLGAHTFKSSIFNDQTPGVHCKYIQHHGPIFAERSTQNWASDIDKKLSVGKWKDQKHRKWPVEFE
jgi:hypothetical protein